MPEVTSSERAAPAVVTIQKWKRPAGSGRWRGYLLGRDGYGTWVFTPAHSTFVGVHADGHQETCEVAQGQDRVGRSCVVLLPADRWFVAHWVAGSDHVIDVDIATPPMRFGDVWAYDDLELDPYLDRSGAFGVEDEDEFEIACGRGRIGPLARVRSLEEVHALRAELTADPSPLLRAGLARLAEGRALELPAL